MNGIFGETGFMSGGIRHVTPRQAYELCGKGAMLIDVREDFLSHFKRFDVPEVFCCPMSMLEENWEKLPGVRPLIFADAAGLHSREAVLFLAERGLGDEIANLAGGIVEWERDGLPLIIDKNERLSGSCMCQLRPRDKK